MNNTETFDICDALDDVSEIRKNQADLKGILVHLRGEPVHSQRTEDLQNQIQELEFEAAEIYCEIVQQFVDMKNRIARLEAELRTSQPKNPPIWSGWSL